MEKRKLKRPDKRYWTDKVSTSEIIDAIHKETGFTKTDIKIVYDAIFKVWRNFLLNKTKSIPLLGLGTLRPHLRAPKMGNAMFGGVKKPEQVFIPPKWTLKFTIGKTAKKEFDRKRVFPKHIDTLYED